MDNTALTQAHGQDSLVPIGDSGVGAVGRPGLGQDAGPTPARPVPSSSADVGLSHDPGPPADALLPHPEVHFHTGQPGWVRQNFLTAAGL